MVDSVPYSITVASRYKKNYMSQKRRLQMNVFLDFYVAVLCNVDFTICGSYMEQVWPHLVYGVGALPAYFLQIEFSVTLGFTCVNDKFD